MEEKANNNNERGGGGMPYFHAKLPKSQPLLILPSGTLSETFTAKKKKKPQSSI